MICYVPSVGCNSSSNVWSDSKLSTMGELSFSRITLPPFSGSPAFLSRVDTSFFGEGVAFLCVSSVPLLFCAEKNYMLNETKGIMITETRTYFPITVLFNYTWTLNFKSQLTIIFIYCIFCMLSIWRNEPWNTETHKTMKIHQSKNNKPWPFELFEASFCFLRGRLKWLTAAKNANISWLLNFGVSMFWKAQ